MTDKLITVDCEFTSKDPAWAMLLTASFICSGEVLNIALKSPYRDYSGNGIYYVDPESMKVNGIDLIEHDKAAEDADKLTNKINHFLQKHSQRYLGVNAEGKAVVEYDRLIFLGQRVMGDILALKKALPDVKWEKFISHYYMDTNMLAYFMKLSGKLPKNLKLGLQDLADYFSIEYTPHIAEQDAQATLKVFNELVSLNESNVGVIENYGF